MPFIYNKPHGLSNAFGLVDQNPSYVEKPKRDPKKADQKIQELIEKKRNKVKKAKKKVNMSKKRAFDISRGGYSMGSVTKTQPFITKIGTFNKGSISSPVSKIVTAGLARAATKGFRTVASALGEELLTQATVRGKYELKRILNPPGLIGRPDSTVPCFTVNGTRTMKNVGTVEPKRSFRTKVLTGNPSSKTLLGIGKENGVEKRVVFDSKMYNNQTEESVSGNIMSRATLSHSCGFNTRNFHIPSSLSYITQRDIIREASQFTVNETQIGLGTATVNASETTYASLLSTTSEFQIFNQSSYLPIVLKLHIVCAKRPRFEANNNPASDIVSSCVKSTDEAGGEFPPTKRDGIPGYYVLNGALTEQSGFFGEQSSKFNLLNSGKGLMDSPYFRDNYEIVETKQKTLEPNDSWQFVHEHQYGGGIDYNLLTSNFVDTEAFSSTDTPLSYFYIIESKGLPCEGVLVEPIQENDPQGRPTPRFGSSPGYYFYEFRKTMKFVRADTNTWEIDTGVNISSGQVGGVIQRRMHMRTFIKNERDFVGNALQNRPFFRLPEDIGTGSNGNTVGSFYIPLEVETNTTFRGAQTKAGSGDNDPGDR